MEPKPVRVGAPQLISVIALIYAGYVIYRLWISAHFATTTEGKIHVILWSIGPPIWFLGEYSYLRYVKRSTTERLAEVKTAQDLATKLWAGILAAILFLGKFG